MLIDGIHVPLTVPFYRDGALYLRKLEHNVARYSLGPVSGLVTLPPGGESACVTDMEAGEIFKAVGETAAREKVLVAGVQRDSVFAALQLAEQATMAHFDALLLAPPRTWRELMAEGNVSAVLLFFRAVADASPLPILLWSDPAELALPVSSIAELAQHANIIGIYNAGLTAKRHAGLMEATKSIQREVTVTTMFAPVTRRMLVQESEGASTFVSIDALGSGTAVAVAPPKPAVKTRTKTVGFQIMSAGSAGGMVPLMQAGAAGAMPTLAASAPQAVHEVLAGFKDGDPALAAEKAARIEAADELMTKLGSAGVKYGCDLNGYFGGNPRLPRLPLTAGQRGEVEAALVELKN